MKALSDICQVVVVAVGGEKNVIADVQKMFSHGKGWLPGHRFIIFFPNIILHTFSIS